MGFDLRLHAVRVVLMLLAIATGPNAMARSAPALPGQWSGVVGGLPNGCNGAVFATLRLSDGRIAMGGNFSACGGTAARHVAIYVPASDSWDALDDGAGAAGSSVTALLEVDGSLVVAGRFAAASGVPARNIARWDGSSWQALGEGINGVPVDLETFGGQIYAAGRSLDGPTGANAMLKRWDGNSWSTEAIGNTLLHWDNYASGLAVMGDSLYASGRFTQFAGITASGIARLRTGGWTAVTEGPGEGVGFDVGEPGEIYVMHADANRLCIAGAFSRAGATSARNAACWDSLHWSALGGGLLDAYGIHTMLLDGTQLLLGGLSVSSGDLTVNNSRIASWNGSSWSTLLPGPGPTIHGLAVRPEGLCAGGDITQLPGLETANNVARRDGTGAWQPLGSTTGQGVYYVTDAEMFQGELHVAGNFRMAGSTLTGGLARWNGQAWHPVGPAGTTGLTGGGNELLVLDGALYVGGSFNAAGGVPASHVARWDGQSWSALGPGPGAAVSAMTVHNGQLHVGRNCLGASVDCRVLRWDGTQWLGVGAAFSQHNGLNGSPGRMHTLAVHEGTLYAGGAFGRVGNPGFASHRNLARWDGTAWQPMAANGSGVDGEVRTLASGPDGLYVGGYFSAAGDLAFGGGAIAAASVVRWDSSQFHALAGGIVDALGGTVYAITAHDGRMVATGAFAGTGSGIAANIAAWDGVRWQRFGQGTNDTVVAMASVDADNFYALGSFGRADDQLSVGVARWTFDSGVLLTDGFEAD